MKRQDLFVVHVTVDGRNLGIWDKKSGGEKDSEETNYKPGGSRKQISLGGSSTIGNVTASKLFDEGVADGVYHWLEDRVGIAPVIVQQQPTDKTGKAFGKPIVRKGTLKRVSPPDADSESNSAALVELEVSCDG